MLATAFFIWNAPQQYMRMVTTALCNHLRNTGPLAQTLLKIITAQTDEAIWPQNTNNESVTQCNLYSNIYPTRCNVTQFILPGNCSTCFRWYHHPSSGAQTTISTVSGICHTFTATCCYHGGVGIGLSVLCTIAAGSSNGVTNTRCCRYSCLHSWWWVAVPPETCRAVSRRNKLCNVASCWLYIWIFLQCMDPLKVKYTVTCSHRCGTSYSAQHPHKDKSGKPQWFRSKLKCGLRRAGFSIMYSKSKYHFINWSGACVYMLHIVIC